jgi:hypothetical protein
MTRHGVYECMSTRLRIALPSVIGVLSLPLIFWDIHNARVIESMGMAWDMGAPIWPYQASDILLRLLNGPACSVTMPIANFLRLAAPMHLLLVIPAILTWWWFLGLTLDRGLTRWSFFGVVAVIVALLLWGATTIPGMFRLRLDYRAVNVSTTLLILRFLTPVAWFTALMYLLCRGKKRVSAAS